MKPILILLLLALPAFGFSKKPPEPKCDSFMGIVEYDLATHGGQTQMSKPKKPQPQAPKADTGEHKRILAGTIDIKPGESLLNLHGATIIYSPELDSLESLWTAYIKGRHKCPEGIPEWPVFLIGLVSGILSGIILGKKIL